MRNYTFTKTKNGLILKSKKWSVTLTKQRGHIHAIVVGPKKRKQGLTSVHDRLNPFELKAVAFHLLNKTIKGSEHLKHTNYAEVFLSCFD